MKIMTKKILEKLIAYQTKNTPRADYLAHYYWGNKHWCFAGSIALLIALVVAYFTIGIYWFYLPLAITPILTGYRAGGKKEKRDGEVDANGKPKGNVDKKDIYYTWQGGKIQTFFLLIIIILTSLI